MRTFSSLARKRFYRDVNVSRVAETGWVVTLDRKQIKTPAREDLILPRESLAVGIANEFEMQVGLIVPATMPLMTIASTALDVTKPNLSAASERIIKFLETDTVSFLHNDDEPELQKAQRVHWNPIRNWATQTFGIVTNQTAGIAIDGGQSSAGLCALEAELAKLDFWRLTTTEIASSSAKSAIIAMGLLRGKLSVDDAVEAALLEEKWQRSRWGTVEGCHDIAEREMAMWLAACSFFDSSLVAI